MLLMRLMTCIGSMNFVRVKNICLQMVFMLDSSKATIDSVLEKKHLCKKKKKKLSKVVSSVQKVKFYLMDVHFNIEGHLNIELLYIWVLSLILKKFSTVFIYVFCYFACRSLHCTMYSYQEF